MTRSSSLLSCLGPDVLTEDQMGAGAIYGTETRLLESDASLFNLPVSTPIYRYLLWREWESRLPLLAWVMLNPSTADARRLDPTITRCLRRTREAGYGGLVVANLFALRSTDPRVLRDDPAPVGPQNDRAILAAARVCDSVVCAWGATGGAAAAARATEVLGILSGVRLLKVGLTLRGAPGHPLYIPMRDGLSPYTPQEAR